MATAVVRASRPRADDIFFCSMALAILGITFFGFARSYYLAGVFHAHLPNLLIHVHGAVFSLWILLLIAQTSLISSGRIDLHRQLGAFGVGLAAAMIVLGLFAGTDSLARGFVPPGSTLDPNTFYAIPFFEIIIFAILVVWAVRARSDGAAHKRLILLATISLLTAPVGRLLPVHHNPLLTTAIPDLFVLVLGGFDVWSRQRIHQATRRGGLFLIVAQQVTVPIGLTPLWHRFAALAAAGWRSLS